MSENIFAEDWVACLEAHYMHVIRINDKVTEPSLSIVMHSAGFTDAQLAELRVRATMHVDQVGADFVPDLGVLDTHDHAHEAPTPAEAPIYNIPIDLNAAAPTSMVVETPVEVEAELGDEVEVEEVNAELEMDAETQDDLDGLLQEEEPPKPDPDAPQQLSLF